MMVFAFWRRVTVHGPVAELENFVGLRLAWGLSLLNGLKLACHDKLLAFDQYIIAFPGQIIPTMGFDSGPKIPEIFPHDPFIL